MNNISTNSYFILLNAGIIALAASAVVNTNKTVVYHHSRSMHVFFSIFINKFAWYSSSMLRHVHGNMMDMCVRLWHKLVCFGEGKISDNGTLLYCLWQYILRLFYKITYRIILKQNIFETCAIEKLFRGVYENLFCKRKTFNEKISVCLADKIKRPHLFKKKPSGTSIKIFIGKYFNISRYIL